MTSSRKGLALVFSTAFISGFSIWLNAFGVSGIPPALFTGLKNIFVSVIIAGVIVLSREWPRLKTLRRADWMRLTAIGLVGGSIPFILFFNGLAQTTGGKAGLIHKTLFIYASLMALYFLKEKITWRISIGLISLLIGQLVFLNVSVIEFTKGDLMIFAATLLWAVEIVIAKKTLASVSPNIVAGSRMFFGGIFIGLYLALTNGWQAVATLSPTHINWILITTILLAGYVLTFYHGLKRLPVHAATSILALGAPVTLILQAVLTDKAVAMTDIAGICIIAASVLILARGVSSQLSNRHVLTSNYR